MFVLSFHCACKNFEFLCASITRNINLVSCNSFTSDKQFDEDKMYGIFRSCNLSLPDEISRFIRHCIRIKKYFHGNTCKVEYMKGAMWMYDENVSEL